MKEYKSIGTICVKDKYNFIYHLCKLEYIEKEDESFKYIFTPNYSVMDLIGPNLFQGIPGLNLDLRLKEYIRENMVPVFISERVPQKNRVDYYELLAEVGLDVMDPIEYLIRTKKQYFGDKYFVIPYEEKKIIELESKLSNENNILFIKKILLNICNGNDILLNGELINDNNRKAFYNIFFGMYEKMFNNYKEKQKIGIEKAKIEGKYKGRKEIEVDLLKFYLLEEKVKRKELTYKDVMKELNISKDKYYRLKNKKE